MLGLHIGYSLILCAKESESELFFSVLFMWQEDENRLIYKITQLMSCL